ncbi:NtaA/DmoA family FMN-dependent monooxygenase [Microbacterium sp. cx-55]|uniref:NtaA/DmoA family FMN-dependent monooxygenase n=1 Tax=Microbacterium sp. cx-55 TaxID=2875948 RepID=UPI001CBB7E79|nr:NtaA/DmoA family FMN-dependent monooxygenase [Microbacterium sp. cx-55]MBZ4487795.1 NtaA/DmoA family FMN-dependent monooxygenase [Microbacterium sp. cx-55]UGB34793.1 NtaA/DmoA family FMN-dependent monooxygenase [Microbacterium sp. cx-55]
MTEPKKLILNLFEMNTVSHITHGLWTLPGNNRHRYGELSYWTELAEILEDGGFDGVFLADVVGAYDTFRGGPETAVREGLQIPSNDPMLVVPAMAAVTRRLGFGMTFSTSYEPPFAFARRMSTLDQLTDGRIGWNVVTSYLPNAARNFGLADEIPHDRRYEIADEFLDVVYKLWEGSWDDDAVRVDREGAIYADPAKVRYIDHVGENFRVAGPHLCAPSPQRTPVLFQATGSPAGTAFAGRHAEVVFTGGRTAEDFRRNADRMRNAATENGRSPDDIRFIVQAGVVVGRTEAEAAEKWRVFRERTSLDGILAHASVPLDLPAFPGEITVREAAIRAGLDPEKVGLPLDATVAETLEGFRASREDRYFVAGTPTVVADEICRWLDEDGIDGINLRQYHSFETARDFAELVVPELRRRGRIRDPEPATLRERLFGRGPTLPETHVARRYHDGANLDRPLPPLRFTAPV